MRAFLCLLVLLLSLPALAQDAGERQTIRGVIERQIEAFKRNDGREAFSYATPQLQAQFGSVDVFMSMVRSGYAPVYRPRQYRFEELRTIDGRIAQPVHVVGPDGQAKLALYFMERQPDGTWRISGCVLLDLEGDEA
jgi:hypothetical protein